MPRMLGDTSSIAAEAKPRRQRSCLSNDCTWCGRSEAGFVRVMHPPSVALLPLPLPFLLPLH